MNKLLLVLATLAVLSFAQEVETAIEGDLAAEVVSSDATLNNPAAGEVVTENIDIEIATVIPEQEELVPETIINIPEADVVEQVLEPVQETTVVDETLVTEETILVAAEQPDVEDVRIVEENVVVEAGDAGNTVVVVEEVDVIAAEVPEVEDVTIVQENVVVEENVIVQELEAPTQQVTVIEQTVVNEEGDAGDTVVVVEEVVILEETILEVPDISGPLNVGGDVSGSATGQVTVGNWTWSVGNDAKVAALPVALIAVAAGVLAF